MEQKKMVKKTNRKGISVLAAAVLTASLLDTHFVIASTTFTSFQLSPPLHASPDFPALIMTLYLDKSPLQIGRAHV